MEPISNLISLIFAVISVLGAIATISDRFLKAKSEKAVLDANQKSSISEAAESIADGANVTVGVFRQAMENMEKRHNAEISSLNEKVTNLQNALTVESSARQRAERKIKALQTYVEELKAMMKKANMTPPPFRWEEDSPAHGSSP